MEADVPGVCVIRSVVLGCLVVGALVVGAAFVDIFVVGTGLVRGEVILLVMVSVSLSNVVLLVRDGDTVVSDCVLKAAVVFGCVVGE